MNPTTRAAVVPPRGVEDDWSEADGMAHRLPRHDGRASRGYVMKQLLVMRHGKSDWSTGSSDHARPLNPRGVAAAGVMGRSLTSMDLAPDHVISSTATRARSTAELTVHAGAWPVDVEATDTFYQSGLDAVVAHLARVPDDVDRLLVTGHMPTWGGLVWRITGGSVAMRTATVAVIDLHLGRSWSNGGDLTGDLLAVLQPRHLTPLDPGDTP